MATPPTENGQIPLLLIHGAWLSARSWENYMDYFGKRGFAVSAPEWPRKQPVSACRRSSVTTRL
jgi:pimeloyl-ACP methyl ester carboxylesterase